MNRRAWLQRSTFIGGSLAMPVLASSCAGPTSSAASAASPTGSKPLKITDVRVILTAPAELRLAVVKVLTNEPELYGLGCATFTQRAKTVATAVDTYLKPFLMGKDPTQIEDIWQSAYVSSYWRNGPVLGNALSGVDMALWDILGKRAGLPLYQLWGGKCRQAAEAYRHAAGDTFEEVEEEARKLMAQGFRHVRVQVSIPGLATYGRGTLGKKDDRSPGANAKAQLWEPRPYVRTIPRLFEHLRKKLGDEVELLHDVHERVPPILGLQLCKDLEQFKLFFLEDPVSPEDIGFFSKLRQQTSTPLAMGELFNNVNEWLPLVSERLIDFIRIHTTQVGGLSMARKIAALCEFFGVRTAWHGPGDLSPVGHAGNVHLDLSIPNFGIQEARAFTQAEQDVFPGCPTIKDGSLWVSDRPGLGIDLNEAAAARFPINDDPSFDYRWGNHRRRDGSVIKP